MNAPSLQLLAARLMTCPTLDDRISLRRLIESWNSFTSIAPEHGDTVSSAMLVGLILYDSERFASLLNYTEREQLISLGLVALERYQQRANPANPLGKLITAALKEVL